MRVLGLAHGQIGDQFIQLPAIQWLKASNKDLFYCANVNYKYSAAASILRWCPYIDAIYISDSYDNFPSKADLGFLETSGIERIYNPMPRHKDEKWWKLRHQTQEVFHQYDFPVPETALQIEIPLNQTEFWPNVVAIAPFGGGGAKNKSVPMDKCERIVRFCNELGFEVIQLGGIGEPQINGATKINGFYEDSVRMMVASRLFITVDTGLCWCASGFKKNLIGLYSDEYYSPQFVKNIQPVNPNAAYLSARSIARISDELIFEAIKSKT